MRILALDVKGYRSLRNIQWGSTNSDQEQLQPRTVVVGPNAAGKSNLLRILDLLLCRAARAALPTQLNKIIVDDEPTAIHFEHTGTVSATVHIEQDTAGIIALLQRVKRQLAGQIEAVLPEQLLIDINNRSQIPVQLSYKLTVFEEKESLEVAVSSITVAGAPWFADGAFLLRDESSDSSKPSETIPTEQDITKSRRKRARETQHKPIMSAFDADLFRALTHGFVHVNCPRILHKSEVRIPPVSDARIPDRGAVRSLDENWHTFGDDALAHRLNAADRNPRWIDGFDALRRHLLEDHGRIGIHSSWSGDKATSLIEHLEIGLTHLPEFEDSQAKPGYIPARFRGTGFVQMLHILSACYLSGATVLGIDELEVNLAPETQRNLWDWLGVAVEKKRPIEQVLVTSHSPVFLRKEGDEDRDDPHKVAVWYAKLDGSKGTTLLHENNKEALVRHFGPMDESIWSFTAASWKQQEGEDGSTVHVAIYQNGEKFSDNFDETVFLDLLTKTQNDPSVVIRIVHAARIYSDRPSPLVQALSLNEWISDGTDPRLMTVEWTEAGTGNAERRVRVGGTSQETGETNELIIYVEEKFKRASIDKSYASDFCHEVLETFDRYVTTLRHSLSGN